MVGWIMIDDIDIMALSEEVERDSQSGKLKHELLAQGNTLFGINKAYPDYIERITPDEHRTLSHLKNGEFEVEL